MRAVEAGDVCRHSREGAFLAAAVALAALALPWLGYELFRLLWQPRTIGTIAIHPGAIDFEIFRAMLGDWFAGRPVYTGPKSTVNTYLPASMLLFWPVYGWASRSVALFAWFVATAVALAWLVRCMVRESGAQGKAERAFVALLPLATYPAGAIVGNGQSTLFVLALLLAALVTLRDREPGWGRDLAVALCLLFALVKPTVAAPFVVAAACVDGGEDHRSPMQRRRCSPQRRSPRVSRTCCASSSSSPRTCPRIGASRTCTGCLAISLGRRGRRRCRSPSSPSSRRGRGGTAGPTSGSSPARPPSSRGSGPTTAGTTIS